MDRRRLALLEALKLGARERGELRLYRRGKLPGMFAQRTRANAEIANQAIADELVEVTRVETIGKVSIEWVRVTPKGLAHLVESESPIRALEDLKEALAANQRGLPIWASELNARIQAEVEAIRQRLDHLATRVDQALARLESKQASATPVSWESQMLAYLEQRERVGLGPRCPLADVFVALKESNAAFSLKDFHAGLKQMQADQRIALLPSSGPDDTPGPEYALLNGAAIYYYAARAAR